MALIIADRVRETSTTVGTGNIVLGGAVAGFIAFSSVMSNGDTTYYGIVLANSWEVGIGTYTASTNSLARTTVLASSNAGALVDFPSGTKNVILTQPSERAVYVNGTSIVAANGATVPNSLLANNSVTFNGVTVALGSSGTITSSPTYPLTNATLTGTTTISGTNNISGTTTITGTTSIASPTLTSPTISGTTTVAGTLAGSITANGGSTITLNGTNNIAGTTTITSPTINNGSLVSPTVSTSLSFSGSSTSITGYPYVVASSSLAAQIYTVNLGVFAPFISLPTNGASGDGTTATVTWANALSVLPAIGSNVVITGMTPTGYNGTYTVTAATSTTVSFLNATTGGVSVQGTVQLTNWAPVYSQSFSIDIGYPYWVAAASGGNYITANAYGGQQSIVYPGNPYTEVAYGDELEMDGLAVSASLSTTTSFANIYVATTNGGPVVGPRQIALKLY